MDYVLLFLAIMGIGSIVAAFVMPPLLDKIADDGSVKVFGIKFL